MKAARSVDTALAERKVAQALFHAALSAVDPYAAVLRHARVDGDNLYVNGQTFDLGRYRGIYVVGAGKATAPMAAAVEDLLGERVTSGVISVKRGHAVATKIVTVLEAGHPIPDADSIAAAQRIAELANEADFDDLVICLLSGGASALMALPARGITLEDKQRVTDLLLRSGAPIDEINAVRKHLSSIKGGWLAKLAHPAQVISLILSDVVGDRLDVIASGPTVPDVTSFATACQVLRSRGLWDEAPASVTRHLEAGCRGEEPETPKPGDPVFEKTWHAVVGSNEIAAQEMVSQADRMGFNTLLLTTCVEGEAREVARVVGAIAKEVSGRDRPVARPACLVVGGETTVTVRGQGTGGRNQELALAAAISIDGMEGVVILAAGTDGTDGPTDAAGAIATGETAARARRLGMDPAAYLADDDSYHFFERLGDLVMTGPTRTNVNDLTVVLVN